jgi:hypothetical protein
MGPMIFLAPSLAHWPFHFLFSLFRRHPFPESLPFPFSPFPALCFVAESITS